MFRKKLNWKQSKTWYVIYVHGRARFIKQLLKKPKHALPLPKENRIRNVGIITIIKWVTCCELVQTFRIRNVLLFGWFFFGFIVEEGKSKAIFSIFSIEKQSKKQNFNEITFYCCVLLLIDETISNYWM